MSYVPIQIPPGVTSEKPSLTSEPSWRSCDKVRFENGQPEKIGGWQKDRSGEAALTGVARSIHTWRLNNGIILTAIGTHEKLHLLYDGAVTDITPLRTEDVAMPITDAFNAQSGSTTVTVTHAAHSAANGDYVTFSGFVSSGVLVNAEVNANHQITYLDANTYTIEVTTAATGTDTADGGASVLSSFEISIGVINNSTAYGWGAGQWGVENWGDSRTIGGIDIDLRYWSLDNFGQNLIACHEEGRIYQWVYAGDYTDRATLLTNSPAYSNFILVTSPDRHLVAFASETTGLQDKMLVVWSDRETINEWTPTAENTAGDYPLSGGSKLVTARRTQNSTLIWTDSSMLSMQFIGAPFTFSFTEIGNNCGAISPACVISKDTTIFWMGKRNFFIYDGVVKILPCTLHREVFQGIRQNQVSKVIGGLIQEFNEIIWLYPSSDVLENDRYIIFNYVENIWYNGTIERTAWDDSELKNYPIGIDSSGTVYEHEVRDVYNADGSAMESYIESSNFDVEEGDKAYLIKELIPDMTITTGSVDYILKTRRYPQSTQVTDTTKTVSANTNSIDVRVRTKVLAIRVESDALNDEWRMGQARINIRPDGGRA